MGRVLAFVYGIMAYLVFFITSLYFIGFLGNLLVPKSIDSGAPSALGRAIVTNVLLLGLFAVQHSVMARTGFKRWWMRFIPEPIERSTYVLLSSLVSILLFWKWRSMTAEVWSIENPVGHSILTGLFWMGWALVVIGSFLISHFDLLGLRQVYLHLKGRRYTDVGLKSPSCYRFVRHPIMLGYVIVFWSTAHMTAGHLLFAVIMTVYILIGVRLEEKDLLTIHGAAYERYRQEVSMLLPVPKSLHAMRKALKVLIAFLFITPLFVSNAHGGSDFKMIDTARLHSMVVDNAYALEGGRNRPFMVIDARTREEYDKAHIFSAINIPEKDFGRSMDLLPKDKDVLLVVYCNDLKSEASRKWVDKAKTAGHTNIVIYSEGFQVWKEKSMPVAPLGKGL